MLLHDLCDLLAEGFDVDLAGAATEVLGDALAGGVVGSCGLEEFVDEEREDERRVDIPVRLEAVEVSAEIRVEPQRPEAVDGLGKRRLLRSCSERVGSVARSMSSMGSVMFDMAD